MDSLDQKLLALLRANARASASTLAKELGVSRATILNRIGRLERDGVIAGYTVRLDPEVKPDGIKAWISIAVAGEKTREVVLSLVGLPEVQAVHEAVHGAIGRWDLLVELLANSGAALAGAIERIRGIKGIQTTETSIHLKTFTL